MGGRRNRAMVSLTVGQPMYVYGYYNSIKFENLHLISNNFQIYSRTDLFLQKSVYNRPY